MIKENKWLSILKNLDYIIAIAALVVLILITFFGVFFRYFLNKPFVWQEEVQLWCFVWVVFFGSGAAFRTGSHVAIEIVVDLMPPKVRRFIEGMCYVLSVFVLGYVMVQSCKLIAQMVEMNRVTNILHVPYWLIYSAVPIGCALMITSYGYMYFKGNKKNSDSDDKEQLVEVSKQ